MIKQNLKEIKYVLRDFPFDKLEPKDADPIVDLVDSGLKIPLNCIQTWEENSFGRTHRTSLNRFRSDNRSFRFSLYTADEREEFMQNNWGGTEILEAYQRAKLGVMKADIFRYCVIYIKGGFYVDIAKKPPKTLMSYLFSNPDLIVFEDASSSGIVHSVPELGIYEILGAKKVLTPLYNSFFASAAGHRFLEILIENISRRWAYFKEINLKKPRHGVLHLTGPDIFLRSYFDYIMERGTTGGIETVPIFDHKINLVGSNSRWRKYPSYMDLIDDTLFL